LRGRDHKDDVGTDGGVTLKLILKKYSLKLYTGFLSTRTD